ncbi:MAG: hypothetical protein KDD42_08360 [Bdellovibrionales bacterium]|nr:hypothetical protein [Bdellovibrionales bacterium]
MMIFFAGAIVALGAEDLRRRHYIVGSPRAQVSARDLIKELRGEHSLKDLKASSSSQRSVEPQSSSEDDELDHTDRAQLKNLLDRIAP